MTSTLNIRKKAGRLEPNRSIFVKEPYSTSRQATISTSLRRMACNMGPCVKFKVSKTKNNNFKVTRIN